MPVLAPDRRQLAFVAVDDAGATTLWVHALDEVVARRLPGTDGPQHPFWSPDGRTFAFFKRDDARHLQRIDINGGEPRPIVGSDYPRQQTEAGLGVKGTCCSWGRASRD